MAIEDVSDDELKNNYIECLQMYDDGLTLLNEMLKILQGRENEKLIFEKELNKRNIKMEEK